MEHFRFLKTSPSGVCAWLVFTATALLALTSPSQDDSYGLNDLLTAIAEIHAIEYKKSNKEKGKKSTTASLFREVQWKLQRIRSSILLISVYDHKSILINESILHFIAPFQLERSQGLWKLLCVASLFSLAIALSFPLLAMEAMTVAMTNR